MRTKLRKLGEQVVVVTGATSGIGLCVARKAARRGARVVLVARNEEDLARIQAEIEARGGQAHAVGADVADARAVEAARDEALERFGRIDTWINNAGVSIYGKLGDVDMVEARRLFDVNFWGVVNGCNAAVPALRREGGALVNVGSSLSDRAIPLQGMYAASKHAVKGYTDALRMELEMEKVPISVTLVKPSAVDTPYAEHARNRMDVAPKPPAPVYAPEIVADTILFCAEHPRRDVYVGGAAKVVSVLEKVAPRLTDKVMERTMANLQRDGIARRDADGDSLFMAPLFEGKIRGGYEGRVIERSLYTSLALRPVAALALGAALVLGFGLFLRLRAR